MAQPYAEEAISIKPRDVEDERLHEGMVGFIGQEGQHAHAHEEIHEHLEPLGLDVEPLVSKIAWLVDNIFNKDLQGRAREDHMLICVSRGDGLVLDL